MPYRPEHAGFELNAGSALTGVLPAAGLAAAIGTACVLAFVFATSLLDGIGLDVESVVGSIVGILIFMTLGTLVGTVFCAFYIGLIGVPIAMLMGERIAGPSAIAVSIIAALGASYVATYLLVGDFLQWDAKERAEVILLALAYAVPAGLLYRRAVINARDFSPWSD